MTKGKESPAGTVTSCPPAGFKCFPTASNIPKDLLTFFAQVGNRESDSPHYCILIGGIYLVVCFLLIQTSHG